MKTIYVDDGTVMLRNIPIYLCEGYDFALRYGNEHIVMYGANSNITIDNDNLLIWAEENHPQGMNSIQLSKIEIWNYTVGLEGKDMKGLFYLYRFNYEVVGWFEL